MPDWEGEGDCGAIVQAGSGEVRPDAQEYADCSS